MSDAIATHLDGSYLAPETRAAAGRYLIQSGNADLLVVLGLAVDVPDETSVELHSTCGRPMPKAGRCRQARQCRIDDDRARAARGGAR